MIMMSERNDLRQILEDAAKSESSRQAIGVIISGARVLAFRDTRWGLVARDLAQVCPPMSADRVETKGAPERVLRGIVAGLRDLECSDKAWLKMIHGLEQLCAPWKGGFKLPGDAVGKAVREIVSGLQDSNRVERLSA
ncbi:hypothetical protein BMS3Bbin13_00009 [bacterium BMS3Bbin13]|nr:hypothetical protein BMS3Bbin13_00009 [bacterium BMS3Bbin13]